MNTPRDPRSPEEDNQDLRHAEYVLGVLDADARAAIEREIASVPHAAAEVAAWQQRLAPLADEFAEVAPPAFIWARIQAALGTASQGELPAAGPRGLWNRVALWRGLAFGAGALAAACSIALAVLLTRGYPTPAPAPTVAYMAATITQSGGQVGWTATMDLQHARMIVVPATPQAIPAGRATELWLLPAGRKPVALGLIAANAPTTIKLDAGLIARLGPTAALAVSVEPAGGSPTGQPTGAVIGKGAIEGA